MDPSIMQLLEEDDEEHMHSAADVEAFVASLNRDIEGNTSTSQPHDPDLSVLPQGSGYTSNQYLPRLNPSTHKENDSYTIQQMHTERISFESDLLMHDSGNVSAHNPGSDDYESQLMKLHNTNSRLAAMSRMVNQQTLTVARGRSNEQIPLPGVNSQQVLTTGNNSNQLARGPLFCGKIPFAILLPILLSQLNKDKAMQLEAIYDALWRKEISRNEFVRHMRSIVSVQMLKMALYKLQFQSARKAHSQPPAQQRQSATASDGQNVYASASPPKLGPHGSKRLHVPLYQNRTATSPVEMTSQSVNVPNMPKFESLNPSSSHGQKNGTSSSLTLDQPIEQHRPHVSVPNGSRKLTLSSSVHETHGNPVPRNSKDEMYYSREGFSTPALTSNVNTSFACSQADATNLSICRLTPAASVVAFVNNATISSENPSVGQNKPLKEVLGSSPPPSSKKQKLSGTFLDQSIEELNDVTVAGGVDLREEEEKLFSGPKEDSRVLEASRNFVQGENERLILEKIPFQIKLSEIVAKSGLKGISNDVELCLSLCVEERIRGLIGSLIRVSKHRVDIEKPRHKTLVISDVGQQIMLLNKKSRAEAEKLQQLNVHPEGNLVAEDGEKNTDEGRTRTSKANKVEDDTTMRAAAAAAANVAARVAVGGDDLLSKWQFMAQHAKQKHLVDAASTGTTIFRVGKEVGKGQGEVARKKVGRCIAVKDVMVVLERDTKMSRSKLIYPLHDKMRTEAAAMHGFG